MFDKFKRTNKEVTNAVEGVKAAGKTVGKIKEVKDKVITWMSENPEKVVLIFLGAITASTIAGEVRRSKTEVNVHVNITPELLRSREKVSI